MSNVLWNVISTENAVELEPDVLRFQIEEGDRLLLCSDGLTKHVEPIEIENMLASDKPSELCCTTLIEMCNERGGQDNITVVVASF
ncbi:MAG: PP2C family protein-serine/threonine phosphatase [Planctomycetota bacterium]|jgi:protein phosphatase